MNLTCDGWYLIGLLGGLLKNDLYQSHLLDTSIISDWNGQVSFLYSIFNRIVIPNHDFAEENHEAPFGINLTEN